MSKGKRVLVVDIEPTPYVTAYLRKIIQKSRYAVDVVFVSENLSQPWNEDIADLSATVLSNNSAKAVVEIVSMIWRGDYGAIHLQGWGHPVLATAFVMGLLKGCPVLSETDTPLPYGLPLYKRLIKRLLYPWLFKIPRYFLPAGSRQAEYLRYYGVPAKNIIIGKMTVDVDHIKQISVRHRPLERAALRRQYGFVASQTVFVFVGRLIPEKGVADLLDTFRELCTKNSNIGLLVVGDGALRSQVERAQADTAQIRYAGRVENKQLLGMLGLADVLVLPSNFEPWGLVVNEAMAAGLAVIASDRVGCVDDLVIDGVTGKVFASGNRDDFRNAVTCMTDSARAEQCGRQAQSLISSWTLEDASGIVTACWESIIPDYNRA